ncbi:Peroxisomal membrane protein PER10 [Fulvia fulva]|uniref:Peroxisomal membrane protein PEX14 n=1 Tax=Passalora fulva TaxID=5499 RepID=A0A9Q8PCQ1_PASFU|nr:Peroxisomal membrane protein PER10 [Fulvia fulva]UJO19997.1 Peroxisomal membrane protein PER10 [Fulvia fulva]
MVREDLIEGAVSFLQDPSVAAAPLEQRIAFLKSKNLTQDEIDASLARVGQGSASYNSQPPNIQNRQPPPQYNNSPNNQYGYPQNWQQPPPEAPRRDWRDYFIAATVMGGVGYGLYWTAKRYIYPLIAPPTPPQLEQDKAGVDASFDKAFALLDQLATDTQELKDAEAQRKERLDAALAEVEGVVTRMKQANEDREQEAKRMAREIGEIRDQIPRAIEKEKEQTELRLKELNTEMKSLKTLVSNRMQGGGAAPGRATPSFSSQSQASSPITGAPGITGPVNGTPAQSAAVPTPQPASQAPAVQPPTNGETNGVNGSASTSERANSMPNRQSAGTPYSRLIGGKAAIPEWQRSAAKKSEEAKADSASSGAATPVQNVNESGTVSEAAGGQA